jgi:hypothetical protein
MYIYFVKKYFVHQDDLNIKLFYLIYKKKFYKAPNEKVTLAEAKKIIEANDKNKK